MFQKIKMPSLSRDRYALCKSNDRFVYASGGTDGNNQMTADNKVMRLDVALKKWESIQPMNGPRFNHASEFLGNSIYVFCGSGNDFLTELNSIESLNLTEYKYWP